ncbi:MAG: hypothetical protein AAGA48_33715 [Myxococcota bacterium]
MPLQVVDGVGWRSGTKETRLEALAEGMMRRSTPHPLRDPSVLPRQGHLAGPRLPGPVPTPGWRRDQPGGIPWPAGELFDEVTAHRDHASTLVLGDPGFDGEQVALEVEVVVG